MQSLASQFYAFLVTISIGCILGMLFDIYRVFLHAVRPRKFIYHLGDLLFWVIASFVGFTLLLIGNWGEIRLYVVIGIALGLGIYFKVISGYFIYILEKIITLIKKILTLLFRMLAFCWMVVTYPFVLIHNIVVIPAGYLGKAMTRVGRGSKHMTNRFILSPVKGTASKIKNNIKNKFKKT